MAIRNIFKLQYLRYYLFLLLIVLFTIYSHPYIMELTRNVSIEKGSIISPYINLLFVFLFVISFNFKSVIRNKVTNRYFFLLVCITLFLIVPYLFDMNVNVISEVRQLIIPLLGIIIGWQLNIDEKKLRFALLLFISLTLFVSLSQVFTNIGGFIIEAQYKTDNKNSLGVSIATSIVLSFLLFLNTSTNKKQKIFLIGLILFLIISILTIRARAASLILIMFIMFILFKKFNSRNLILGVLGVSFFVLLVVFILPKNAQNFIVDSFTLNQDDDITSDRMNRNNAAINFLSDNLISGNLKGNALNVGWVHNYPLLKLFEYGLIVSMPILLLYLSLLFTLIKGTLKKNIFNIYNVGFVILLIPFGISLAEPSFPFGPGTTTVFNFILFGISLRYNYQIKKINDISIGQ